MFNARISLVGLFVSFACLLASCGGKKKSETLTAETGSITGVITSAGIDLSDSVRAGIRGAEGNCSPPPCLEQGVRTGPRRAPSKPIPIPDATVSVGGTNLETQSDKDGKFRIDLVPPGRKPVVAEYQAGDGAVHKILEEVEVEAGKVKDLKRVELKRTGAITGNVKFKGKKNHLGIDVFVPGTSFMAKTAGDGNFTILHLPPGRYKLTALRPGYLPMDLPEVDVEEDSAAGVGEAELEPDTTGDPSFYGSIGGRVLDPNGNPVASATVRTIPDSDTITSGEDGTFVLVGLFPTVYSVRIDKEGYVSNSALVQVASGGKVETDLLLIPRPKDSKKKDPDQTGNRPPVVALTCPESLKIGGSATLSVVANDPDGHAVRLGIFTADGGTFAPPSQQIVCVQSTDTACRAMDWVAPSTPGLFTVQVTANDGKLSGVGQCQIVVTSDAPSAANQCPVVSITGTSEVKAGDVDTIQATALDPNGDPLSYNWTATGGTLSKQTGASVSWTAPKSEDSFDVSVCVTDGQCQAACAQLKISVVGVGLPTLPDKPSNPDDPPPPPPNRDPSCKISGPTSALINDTVSLTATGSDPDGDAVTIQWSASGGKLSATNGPSVTWTAPGSPGSYAITCTASDGNGGTGTSQLGVAVNNPPVGNVCPTLSATGPTAATAGTTVTVDFSGSDSDAGPNPLSITCTVPNGSYAVANVGGSKAHFEWQTPQTAATHTFACSVTDGSCPKSASHSVSVSAQQADNPPTVSISCATTSLNAGQSTTCTASGSDPEGNPVTFSWTASGGALSTTTGSSVTYTAPGSAGTYTVTVTASDGTLTNSASQSVSVVVPNTPPTISVSGQNSAQTGQQIALTASASDANNDPLTCSWGASGGTLSNTSCSGATWTAPNTAGSYTITATAGDGKEQTSASHVVTVTAPPPNQPPTVSISGPSTIWAGGAIDLTCTGTDPEGDNPVTFTWSTSSGTLSATSGASTHWTLPNTVGTYTVTCTAKDSGNRSASANQNVTTSAIPPGGAYECDANTVALYHFDETSGTTAYDSCGSNHGTISGATINQAGKMGQAYSYNGTSSTVQLSSNPVNNLPLGTFEAWINVASFAHSDPGQYIFYKYGNATNYFDLYVVNDNATGGDAGHDRQVWFGVNSTSNNWGHARMSPGTWYHIAVTWDGGNVKLFINGLLDSSYASSSGVPNTNQSNTIGCIPTSVDCFDGLIDEVRISNKARTPDEFNVVRENRAITWTVRASMPTPRSSFAAAAVNGKIYAIGGTVDGTNSLGTNEEYDPVTNSWATKASMPTTRYAVGAAAVNGKVYTIGGINTASGYVTTSEEYDPGANTWTTKASMSAQRGYLSAAPANGKIYAIGGYYGSSTVATNEQYDPVANSWVTLPAMPTSRSVLAAITVNGKIYAIGGSTNNSNALATVEEYDPVARVWSGKSAIPTPRHDAGAVEVDGKIYVIGGYDGTSRVGTNQVALVVPEAFIPAGKFVMGSDPTDPGAQASEQPEHVVHLSAYWMDKFEVTNAAYKACVDAGVCTAPSSSSSPTRGSYYGNATYDNYPVIWLSRDKAIQYCQWAGKRLPTEAEWEKAARGPYGDERTYPWGEASVGCSLANTNNCVGDTSAVGSYSSGASPYGLLDLTGNVWEFINSGYDADYYKTSPSTNPQGSTTTYTLPILVRGGGWAYTGSSLTYLRVSARDNNPTLSITSEGGGFRCTRNP